MMHSPYLKLRHGFSLRKTLHSSRVLVVEDGATSDVSSHSSSHFGQNIWPEFLSSHSSTGSNKYLVLYSLALVVVYLTIFTLRILTSEREQIYTLNRVVTNLHLFCYIAIFFFSDILSNWINSKSYC
jgi:hypothetical protein